MGKPNLNQVRCGLQTAIPKTVLIATLILFWVTSSFAEKPVAELPRVLMDTTWQEPVGGRKWAAHTTEQLSKALESSAPGDVIVLDAGATYVGNFKLPAKSNPGNKWIYIVSSALAKLPEGRRVSPTDAVNMPKLVTPNVEKVFSVSPGANHYRMAGLELTAQSKYPPGCPDNRTHCMTYFLVNMQDFTGEGDYIWLDRVYAHGSATQDLQSCLQINWEHAAVVDSYIDDVHIKGFDSTGIAAYHTVGPIKIVNNFVSASTENIMFGGSGGNKNPGVPSDIEIRNNWLYKPLAWAQPGVGCCGNQSMVVKNSFELKSAQRVLFDNNLIENVWAGGQLGFAIVLTIRSAQSGDFAVVNDITITNNVLKNVVSGFNMGGADDQCGAAMGYPNCKNAGSQARWNIANNLILFYDPKAPGGLRNLGMGLNGGFDRINKRRGVLHDVVLQHNTMVPAESTPCWNSMFFAAGGQKPPISNLTNNIWVLDNVLCRPPTGDWGLQGTTGLTQYMGDPPPLDPRFAGNVIYVSGGDRSATFPPHNYLIQKAIKFDSKFQLIGVTAATRDNKPAGFTAEGVRFPLETMLKQQARAPEEKK